VKANILAMKKICGTASALALAAALVVFVGVDPAQAQTYNINFPAPTTFQIDACPTECNSTIAATTADMNGDGNLDVVNIDGHDDINVMLGKGNGTFQPPITLSFNDGIFSADALAVGAFSGGSILDVAVWGSTDQGYSQVEIFLGNGTGDLTYSATYTVPNSNNFNNGPNSLVAVDVNGDGKLDLVALTPYDGVFVLMGNGNGTFQAPVNYATVNPNGPNGGVAVSDLNGDGHPDLAISASDGLDILLNNGDGTFGAAAYYAGPSGFSATEGIAVGVLRKGKKPDVVVNSGFSTGFATFLNSGTGTFTTGTLTSVPSIYSTNNVVLADINNDGKLDVVIPDSFGNAYTFFGTGKATFKTGPAYSLEVYNGSNYLVALGDFNNDGALDLFNSSGDTTSTVSFGRGDGSFQTAQFYPFSSAGQYQNLAVADFNGDGIPDVVSQTVPNGSIAVVLGAAHGVLTSKSLVTSVCTDTFTYGIAAGDVNGDGKPDVVSVFGGAGGSCNHMVAVSLGLGTGKFKKAAFYPTGAASTAQEMQIYLVDVNGDGALDIVISNSDGSISVLLNKGKGTFGAPNVITGLESLTEENNPLTFADFNGDGKMDIAAAANSARTDAQAVYVLLGNGNGTFASPITTTTGFFMQGLVAGDFNGDGKQDLFAVTSNWGCSGEVGNVPYGSGYQYLQGHGDGTFTVGAQNCVAWSNPGAPVATDFNADGKLDVVVPYGGNQQYNGVAIFQGMGNGTFTANQDYYPGYGIVSLGVADFNGDGMPDVAALNCCNGNYVSILLNATQPVSISPLNVSYGSETVGSKKSETVILTNDEAASLAISSVTIGGTDAGDFSETNNCGSSRKAGWDCTITVTFKPTATGTRSATLTIKDGAGTQTVALNGTGK
jgi:FG-GAP-like repeat/Abnormal spindle-like microcephaly-assoc'd, ASPM-SPD-2-Hydin/FG-GAP repeat